MRRAVVWFAAVAMLAALVSSSPAASTTWTHGYDISWPQCAGRNAHHLPSATPRYAVLGLTHGTGHTANPCFGAQLAWARDRGTAVGAYLVASYPTSAQVSAARTGAYGNCGTTTCRLHNDGAAQAADALRVMHRAGLSLRMVWVDVEFRHNPPWTHHHDRNRTVLEGIFRGLHDAGVDFGIYTTSYMWDHITGGWTVRAPNWLPSGDGSSTTARSRCRTTGTGGVTWLVQYTREWDEDLTCPVMDAIAGHGGPLWPYRTTTLTSGSSGKAVSALQRALKMTATGSYDLQTTLAVAQFQRAHALPVNGSVDSDDWRALGAFRFVGGRPFLLHRMVSR